MGLVTLQSVTIGAALLLICCGDSEAKARRLLNQAQALEREGKEQEAQPLLDELLQGYPQTTAATPAHKLLNQKKKAGTTFQCFPWQCHCSQVPEQSRQFSC